MSADSQIDGRLVLNWSQTQAKFKLQFVSPDKRFFDWYKSTSRKLNNSKRSLTIEEFILDEAFAGEWLINLEYSNTLNDMSIPLYLKYTFYKDYASSSETKHVKMIKLLGQGKKVTLGKVNL